MTEASKGSSGGRDDTNQLLPGELALALPGGREMREDWPWSRVAAVRRGGVGTNYYPHFRDEETDALRCQRTCSA